MWILLLVFTLSAQRYELRENFTTQAECEAGGTLLAKELPQLKLQWVCLDQTPVAKGK